MERPQQPMILPKGIVLNSPEIYAEVASYPVVPPEKIWQYWHVYTTTFRRLIDPTAFRLENFWWHVWGSDKRYLPGAVLAKLFEEFSDGPTFVPLRGPPNRYDGPSIPRSDRRPEPAKTKQSDHVPNQTQNELDNSGPSPIKLRHQLTPSSSRPPPPHPILKKARGPSASGPRPTARFDLPAESDDEDAKEDDLSSGSTAVAGVELPPSRRPSWATQDAEMPPPPRPSHGKADKKPVPATEKKTVPVADKKPVPVAADKKPEPVADKKPAAAAERKSVPVAEKKPVPVAAKKFTVSTAASASKRRPVLTRRQNSQSSIGPDTGSREGASTASIRYLGSSSQKANHAVTQPPAERNLQGISGSSSTGVSVMSTKAAGKRPSKSPAENNTTISLAGPSPLDGQDRPVIVQQTQAPVVTVPRSLPTKDITAPMPSYEITRSRRGAGRGPAPVAGFVADQEIVEAPRMVRSRSDIESTPLSRERSKMVRQGSISHLHSQTLLASSVVGTSTTTVQGQLDAGLKTPDAPSPETLISPNQSTLPSRQSSSSLANMQFKPTMPNPTPAVPFQRTKSQLAFLLEKDKQSQGL